MKNLSKNTKKALLSYYKNGPDKEPKFTKLAPGSFKCLSSFGVLLPNEKETSVTKPCEMEPFHSFKSLFDHLLYHHRIPKIFSCIECEKIFIGETNLRHHETHDCSNLGSQSKCIKCSSQFSNWTLLISHLKSYHKMMVILKCLQCQKVFETKVINPSFDTHRTKID